MDYRYLIVSDDFTGANDTGVQLKQRGIPVEVVFRSDRINESEHSVVLDTESRGMIPIQARQHTEDLVRDIDFDAFQYVIKKVDSTLRGNVAEEIAAVDRYFKSELIVFAPALPDLGRTTEKGVHKLNGVAITETELALDPRNPVKDDNLKSILSKVFQEEVVHIDLEAVRSGFSLDKARIYTFDAVLNTDLINILIEAKKSGKRILWVGTAAIADNIMKLEKRVEPVFGICSSVSSVTSNQIKVAEKAGIKLVKVPIPEFLIGADDEAPYVSACIEYLMDDKDVILCSSASYDRGDVERSIEAGKRINKDIFQISDYTQEVISRISEKVLESVKVSGVFLTGGDTAIGFLKSIRARGSYILSEVAIGIPMMRILGGKFDGMKLITKAGAFGKEDAITYAFRKLKEQESND